MCTPSLEERARVSDEMYARNPERFGVLNSALSGWWTQFVPHTSRLLELGCGTGRDIQFYLKLGFSVTGVDYSPTAVAKAKSRVRTIGKAEIVELKITRFLEQTEPESYDAVCANLVYGGFTLKELKAVFALVHRALKPFGVHAYCVRSIRDSHCLAGEKLGRYTRLYKHEAGGFLETYFTPKLCGGLSRGLFETIKIEEDLRNFTIRVVERKKC